MRVLAVSFALLLGGILMASPALAQQWTLAKDGKSDYAIVLGKDASPSEKHAAAELQRFLKEISGAELPIVTEDQPLPARRILLGESGPLHAAPVRVDFKRLGNEGFHIETAGPDLIIAGGRLRGTMYGAYAFLEEVLGCRWYSSKVSRIPKRSEITIGPLDMTEVPAFEYREPWYDDAFDADWAARNRANSNRARLGIERGGRVSFGKGYFCHTFRRLLSPDEYYKDHPEYFSLKDGKRLSDGEQLCLSNPEVLRIATQKILKAIEAQPEATIFSVSQNDWYNPCQCGNCKRIVEEEGSEAGPLLRFVNAIGAEVAKTHPDKIIHTLAYQYTRFPPKKTVPGPNVRVQLSCIENCFAHPFEQCPKNTRFVDILKQWSQVTDKLYVWHYSTNFHHYLMPFPDYDELFADIPLYYRSGVKGVMEEGNYSPGGGGEFDELRAYVVAKLLWNPTTDPWAVVDDFLGGYYGKAGPVLRRYINLLQSQVRGKDVHMGIFSPVTVSYITPDFLAQANKLFDEAEKAAADDPGALRRVKHARLSIRYTELMLAREKDPSVVKSAAFKQFIADCKADGMQQIREWQTIDETVERLSK